MHARVVARALTPPHTLTHTRTHTHLHACAHKEMTACSISLPVLTTWCRALGSTVKVVFTPIGACLTLPSCACGGWVQGGGGGWVSGWVGKWEGGEGGAGRGGGGGHTPTPARPASKQPRGCMTAAPPSRALACRKTVPLPDRMSHTSSQSWVWMGVPPPGAMASIHTSTPRRPWERLLREGCGGGGEGGRVGGWGGKEDGSRVRAAACAPRPPTPRSPHPSHTHA